MEARMREWFHHEHHYVRQCLALLQTAIATHNAPPAGHAFWRYVSEAAVFLETELPLHVADEEARLFPRFAALPGHEAIAALEAEHRDILALARVFAAKAKAGAAPTPELWDELRAGGHALLTALEAHLGHEEQVLCRLALGHDVDHLPAS